MKIKIGQSVKIPNTTSAVAGLEAMHISPHIAGRFVKVSQVSPHGVSFILPWTITAQKPEGVELHLGIRYVKDVLGG